MILYRPVPVEEKNPHGAGSGCCFAVTRGADGEVNDAIAVEIADSNDRTTELISGVQLAAETAFGRAYLTCDEILCEHVSARETNGKYERYVP